MLDLNPVNQNGLAVGRPNLHPLPDLQIERVACGGLNYNVKVREGNATIQEWGI